MDIPILLYHSVSDTATSLYQTWAVSPPLFEMHMAYLKAQGYQPITITKMVKAILSGGNGLPENPVVITFDDGLADFREGALPILNKYEFSSTLFITTSYIGSTSRWLVDLGEQERSMLTWEQIRFLEGVEIGAHSCTHPQLDLLPIQRARDEIVICKKILEKNIGKPVNTFAFPYGYYTQALLDVVKEAGYSSACTVGHAMACDKENVFAIPRIIVTSDTTTEKLTQYLQGKGLRRLGFGRNILRKAWRTLRWIRAMHTRKELLAPGVGKVLEK